MILTRRGTFYPERGVPTMQWNSVRRRPSASLMYYDYDYDDMQSFNKPRNNPEDA
jgi:hypothetical protein